MKQLKDILHNNEKKYIKTTEIQIVCAEVITKVIGIKIAPSKIQHKNSTLIISIQPIIKSEIYIQKEKILKIINQRGIPIVKIR